jgi:uncharacterized protein
MTKHLISRCAISILGIASLFATVRVYAQKSGDGTTSVALAAPSAKPSGEVTIEQVRDQGFVALFIGPADRTPHTTVLMLAGSGGGFPDAAAARDLATSGYRVLSLAYVRNWQGQPAELSRPRILDVPLEYVFGAIDWLKSRQDVRPDRIVLMGESRGAELALLVGSYRPDVGGIIAFSPSELRWGAVLGGGAAWTLNGVALPYAQGTRDPSAPLREFTDVLDGPPEVRDAATIAVERIRGPILLISSRADQVWPSTRMADDIERRLREHRFPYRVGNLQFDDASHLLMGSGPGITDSRTAQSIMHFGGTQSGTETARNVGWARAKQFLADL